MQPVNIGLLGLGTVGGGTIRVLARNASEIARRAGRKLTVRKAFTRDPSKPRICSLEGIELVTDPWAVVEDPEIQVVAELIGGISPAKELVLRAIELGKAVVTANKALIALHGNEIFARALERGVMVAFEAAVAGGIPIIKVLREGLAGNRIEWVAGIINGTCNFILSAMREQGKTFAQALQEAQAQGFAEADPSFDVGGIDAAHKLTILAAIAFGIPLKFDQVYIEGITAITPEDIRYAEALGYRIKSLGIARRSASGIELRVHPCLVPARRLLASVEGVMNAVVVKGDAVGPTLYYGPGAGAEPTASAVVADLVDVVRVLTADPENRVPHLAFQPEALSDLPILPIAEVETAYYLRLTVADQPGVLADIARILADQGISIEAVVQKEPQPGQADVPLIFLTHRVKERALCAAQAAIEALPTVKAPLCRIRLETLE